MKLWSGSNLVMCNPPEVQIVWCETSLWSCDKKINARSIQWDFHRDFWLTAVVFYRVLLVVCDKQRYILPPTDLFPNVCRRSFNEEADLLTFLQKGPLQQVWGHHGNHSSSCLSSVAFQVRNSRASVQRLFRKYVHNNLKY